MVTGKAYFFIAAFALLRVFSLQAQKTDTLPLVKLRSQKPVDIAASTVQVQQLNKTAIALLNSVTIADAAKYFSGVVIKDYGGLGGLKTISVRSLGANHTVTVLDGMYVGDAQGGQIDLGRFSVENIESITLSANNPIDVLAPARSFSGANVLALSTTGAKPTGPSACFKIKYGSFGFINPSVSFKNNISKKITQQLFAQYQGANGAYSFKDYETGTTVNKRNNADIKAYHAEYDLAFYINDSNSVKLKTYFYHSKRGLPGAVVLYNPFSSQRLNTESFFTQISWRKTFNSRLGFLLSGKYAGDYKFYIDPTYQNSAGKLINEFHQKEYYTTAAFSYKFSPVLLATMASDYFYNTLVRTDPFALQFANPARHNFMENILLQYKSNTLEIAGNILFTSIHEKTQKGPAGKNFQKLTPAVSVSIQPVNELPIRVRASYKQLFRAPTFDDLYYTNIGNTALNPEWVKQFSAGITATVLTGSVLNEVVLTADAYFNKVKDKILAVPRQNLFQWTILNIGKADIKGLDVSALLHWRKAKGLEISSRFSYSYQNTLDVSNPASALYKTQLAYTPRHSGSIHLTVACQMFQIGYNVLLSSYRYRLGEPNSDNLVQGWATQDLSVAYQLPGNKFGSWQLVAELNNMFNQSYEIIKFYPMPGINYRFGIAAKF